MILRLLSFLLGSRTVLLFWIYLCIVTLLFVLQWPSFHCFIVIASVSFDFLSNSEWNTPFHRSAFDFCPVDWDGLCNYLRDAPWKSILNLDTSVFTSECVNGSMDELTHVSPPINLL